MPTAAPPTDPVASVASDSAGRHPGDGNLTLAGSIAPRLLPWFDHHGRHTLPWQTDRTAYRVWISEIMLQQTQVATVVPYFQRFVARFPNVTALAQADVDEVLALWSGLGYYARARNLHNAARRLVADHGAELPVSFDALAALPGIGRSTAGAILALAHEQRFAILDGNVKRVLTRYHAVNGWPGDTRVARELWSLAEHHTPHARVRDYTQAIMDLGAMVCTRSRPACARCPLSSDCVAHADGSPQRYPTPRRRRERPCRETAMLIVRAGDGAVLLQRRPAAGVWGGLYSFPELGDDESARQWCQRRLGVRDGRGDALPPVTHAFTHFELKISPVLVRIATRPAAVMEGEEWLWYKPGESRQVGLPAPVARLLEVAANGDPGNLDDLSAMDMAPGNDALPVSKKEGRNP
jgi:A/G-specific adenine glycosylase